MGGCGRAALCSSYPFLPAHPRHPQPTRSPLPIALPQQHRSCPAPSPAAPQEKNPTPNDRLGQVCLVVSLLFMLLAFPPIRISSYIPPSLPPQLTTGRPVSPHVTIYRFPIGALTSIATRVTGGALTVGLTGISLLVLGGADVPSLMSSLGNSMVGVPAKVLFSFPLIYHYGSGLRHFVSVGGR